MKNRIEAVKKGKVIEIKIIANSEEMADKFFDLIEAFGIAVIKVDLEREWEKSEEDDDAV